MSSATLDRRIRKLEGVFGSDDPRHYLGRPLVEWPDAALERALSMSDEERAELLEDFSIVLGDQ
jgi:hypothetical protein